MHLRTLQCGTRDICLHHPSPGNTANRFSGMAVLRVPADQFDATVTEVKGMGTLRSVSLNTQEVTEEYGDLQAQQVALQQELGQYNRIMEKAMNVSDILQTQEQIERV
jgi:hypothetical protein